MLKKIELKRIEVKGVYDYLKIALWGMFLIQVCILGFFNLTQLKHHIGYDTSSYYLKAIEMAKQGSLFIENWVDQTTLYFDSSVPFAAVLYAITGNIFVSYGIVNFAIDIAIFYCFYAILRSLKVSDVAKGVCLNLIACIYIAPSFNNANDVSYFSSALSQGNWYGLKVLIILMVVKMILELEDNKVNYLFIAITEILLFISGVSSGWYLLVTVIAPIMVFYVIKVFVNNSWKELLNRKMALLAAGAVLILTGKFVALHVIGFVSKDSDMVLVGLKDFWKNLGSIILGFMELVGAFSHSTDVSALTLEGIIYLLGFVVFGVCVIGTVCTTKKILLNFRDYQKYAILLCVVVFNVLMFAVLYTTYGQEIFETRYLIPLFILLTAGVGGFIDALDDGLILKYVGVGAVFVCLLVLNIYYNHLFYTTKNNYDILVDIGDKAEEFEMPVVYFYGSDLEIDCRNMRVVDDERIYKYVYDDLYNATPHWGDYTYFDDVALVQGRNMLVTTEDYFADLPDYIKNQYTLYGYIDRYSIYFAEVNKFDLKSGINADVNIDFPISYGICTAGGSMDQNGSFVTDGTEGFAMWGPYTAASAGIYDFVINYEILQSDGGTAEFSVSYNYGNVSVAQTKLDQNETSAILQDVQLEADVTDLEYKVYNYQGTIIRIDSVEIIRKNVEK